MTLPNTYLDQIKKLEGFYRKPYWDHKQWSVGYGSRASGPDDIVDEVEAEKRLSSEMQNAATQVDAFAPGLDEGTRAALVSLTYNAGPKWMESGLGQAIKTGDLDRARASFLQYNKASGQTLPGLVNRRAQELAWFGTGGPARDPRNVAMNGGQSGVDPDGYAGISGSIHTQTPGDTGVPFAPKPVTQTPSSAPPSGPPGAFGPSMMANIKTGLGAFSGAMGGGSQDSDIAEQLAKRNNEALSEEDQRAAQALQMVVARNPRRRQGAFE